MANYTSTHTGAEIDSAVTKIANIPNSTISDNGKVLKVNSTGNPTWANINTLPNSTNSDSGKVLKVNSTGNPVWGTAPTGGASLPNYTTANDGLVLTVAASAGNAVLRWSSPIPEIDPIEDEYKILIANGSGNPEWQYPAFALVPCTDSYEDYGKFLMCSGSGEVEWATISGGGGSGLPELPINTGWNKLLVVGCGGTIEWSHILPDMSYSGDEGSFLRLHTSDIGYDGLEWASPFPYYDNYYSGMILAVDAYGELEWIDSPIPNSTSSDSDKVLKVNNYGIPTWQTIPALPSTPTNHSGAHAGYRNYILGLNQQGNPIWQSLEQIFDGAAPCQSNCVLCFDRNNSGKMDWATYLPEASASDQGKVITVNEYGNYVLDTIANIMGN